MAEKPPWGTYQFPNRLNILENNLHKLDGLALELANRFHRP
ncbi:hypothetical protein [Flavobacterium sp. HJ-32-4]|nr:hypothetical protein [Flavobacterium sp. HJ-32-4]